MKQILVWDWDGTLADTLEYKYVHIWEDLFREDRILQSKIIDFIQTPEGKKMNRYGLIRKAMEISGNEDKSKLNDEDFKNDIKISEIVAQYDQLAKSWVFNHGLFPGVRELLDGLFKAGHSMYLVSGGGTDSDLEMFLEKTGINSYFKAAFGFGTPGSSLSSFGKEENFIRVKAFERETDPTKYIFIGDTDSDRAFAESQGASFIGIASRWNRWRKEAEKFLTVESVTDVQKYLIEP